MPATTIPIAGALAPKPGPILLDTNMLLDAYNDRPVMDLVSRIPVAHRYVSIVAWYEFLYDARTGTPLAADERRRRARWRHNRVKTIVRVDGEGPWSTFEAWMSAGLERMSLADGLIAATAVARSWPLATRDQDFRCFNGLRLIEEFLG